MLFVACYLLSVSELTSLLTALACIHELHRSETSGPPRPLSLPSWKSSLPPHSRTPVYQKPRQNQM